MPDIGGSAGSRTSRDARIKFVKGRMSPKPANGEGRTVTGKRAPEKTIKSPETYVGRAHSNFDAKMEYAPSKKPRPIEARTFTMSATPNRKTDTGVRRKGIDTPKSADEASTATASETMEVAVDVTNEPRHLPARYGGEDFG